MAGSVQLTMEVLCDSLDQLCIQQLELMDQLIKANMTLEESMRSGYFLLGKTRYSMGTHAVSATQLPSEDREVARLAEVVSTPVSLEHYQGDILYHRVDAKFGSPITQVTDKEEGSLTEEGQDPYTDTGTTHQGLRKRKSRVKGEQGVEDIDQSEMEEKEPNPSENGRKPKAQIVNSDPIRWFSALPPQTLRQAQTDFKTAVCLVTECATTQLKLRAVNKELARLYGIKNKLDRIEKET